MMKITHHAVVGTLESSDVMMRIAPRDDDGIELQINSTVFSQFGESIRQTVLAVLADYQVTGVQLIVEDKGALECVLRARLEVLLARASQASLSWRV